jgi:hypothetical protein
MSDNTNSVKQHGSVEKGPRTGTEAEQAQGGDFMRFTIDRAHRVVDRQTPHSELRALGDRL